MGIDFNTIEDFLTSDSFVAWVFKTDEKDADYWDTWLADNPDKQLLVKDAVRFLKAIKITELPLGETQLASAEARLKNAITLERGNKNSRLITMNRRRIWYAAAAVFLIGILAVSLNFFTNPQQQPQFASNYGQIIQDKLPDGTEIILNAHSNISYPKIWKEGTDREVWIKGEAFFHVKKTARHNKFIVHTDAFDIEVTGTSFDVINRAGKSSIILKEGSVKIHRPGEADIMMHPGDIVEYTNNKIQKNTVTRQDYLAWTESKLVFDNTSLTEVAEIIKHHYGVDVKLVGENLPAKTISGIMPNNNLSILLQSLEATQEFSIKRIDNTITISAKN